MAFAGRFKRRRQNASRRTWVDSEKGGGLFDLSKDVSEKIDLSASHPEILKLTKQRFETWETAMDAAEPRGPFRDF